MTTKRELERLARQAFGPSAVHDWHDGIQESGVVSDGYCVVVGAPTKKERSAILAAALRGIIQWKEVEKSQ